MWSPCLQPSSALPICSPPCSLLIFLKCESECGKAHLLPVSLRRSMAHEVPGLCPACSCFPVHAGLLLTSGSPNVTPSAWSPAPLVTSELRLRCYFLPEAFSDGAGLGLVPLLCDLPAPMVMFVFLFPPWIPKLLEDRGLCPFFFPLEKNTRPGLFHTVLFTHFLFSNLYVAYKEVR